MKSCVRYVYFHHGSANEDNMNELIRSMESEDWYLRQVVPYDRDKNESATVGTGRRMQGFLLVFGKDD